MSEQTSEMTRRDRLQAELDGALKELGIAESCVKAQTLTLAQTRELRDLLERKVWDLRVALNRNRDGSERKARASKAAPVPEDPPQLRDADE